MKNRNQQNLKFGEKNFIFHFLFSAFCLFLLSTFYFLNCNVAQAASATLFLSPPSGTYNFGDTFSIFVKVNTGGENINATEGTLIFNPAELQAISISKSDSFFTLWTTEPAFYNSLGSVVFGGGTPANFNGTSGTIIKITFKSRAVAAAQVNFSSGSVLAADGKGTNILATMSGGTYIIKPSTLIPPTKEVFPEEEYVPPPTPDRTPLAPAVSSPTHPDSGKWYSNNDPEFNWKLPSDVTGVSLMLDEKPISDSGNVSDGLMESKKYEDVADGIWYLHIKFRNQYGWGEILHRKVLIDTVPPLPFEIAVQKEDLTDPRPILIFETTDELSGINYYKIKIGQGDPFPAETIKTQSYSLPPQFPGEHPIEVKAFDKAENYTLASSEVEIMPIEPPKITKIPKSIRFGDVLEIEGEAVPEMTVRIYIQQSEKEPFFEKVKAGPNGKFVLKYEKSLIEGDYLVWAQSENKKGALSYPTKKYSLKVGLPLFLKFGKIALDYLTTMITLILLIVGVILVIFYSWYRVSIWRKKLRGETKEVIQSVYGAFRALREEIQEQIEDLDGQAGLTPAEKKVRDNLKEALDVSEKFISKELRDVEKELE